MKEKVKSSTKPDKAGSIALSLAPLVEQVSSLIESARRGVAASANSFQVLTNFEIGRLIVEHEQQGERRAGYGKETLKHVAARLWVKFGRGFSESNLEYMRKFFLTWKDRSPQISQTLSGKLPNSPTVLTLSWSHYVLLLGIKDPNERSFYEVESAQSNWSFRELKRQVGSCLYERLALSRDKTGVRELAAKGQIIQKPQDILKSPLVLEFLGMDEKSGYSETSLESALIAKLQHFLLELGKGFLFEARQKRFSFDEDHFFVDLVFYNRLLRCYVLIDLKLDKLTHQDLGQMQMYVNYFDRFVKTPEENPTIGIVLCKSKKDALIELTLPKDANIYASQYQLYLPSKEELRQRLIEWTADEEDGV